LEWVRQNAYLLLVITHYPGVITTASFVGSAYLTWKAIQSGGFKKIPDQDVILEACAFNYIV
jgi:threonine/homoserine/homoserine lactone efflux protein